MLTELKTTELFPGGVYTFRQIKDATQNFNVVNKLGEGGFGPVYKVSFCWTFSILFIHYIIPMTLD